jgi:hypothetical protein
MDPELARFLRDELGMAADTPPVTGWTVTAPLWVWRGNGDQPSSNAWHFITITGPPAEALRAAAPGRTAAWGSVKLAARIGGTAWTTSAFPSKAHAGYLLPVKAAVRRAERLAEGDMVTVALTV